MSIVKDMLSEWQQKTFGIGSSATSEDLVYGKKLSPIPKVTSGASALAEDMLNREQVTALDFSAVMEEPEQGVIEMEFPEKFLEEYNRVIGQIDYGQLDEDTCEDEFARDEMFLVVEEELRQSYCELNGLDARFEQELLAAS